MGVFFIADTHFGDKDILRYENRPFNNVGEMDKVIIDNWNSVISNDDTCFIVGDYSFYGRNKTIEITQGLNGHKCLILGNHDNENEEFYMDCGFEMVSRYPIVYDDFWIVSHKPVYINENMPYANIFGHVHKNPIYSDYSSRSFCVCSDRINFTPVNFEKIKELVKSMNV